MNHYPHHIGDFNNATWHLTFVERALYRELLDLYYDKERALNADFEKLARRVKANTEELRTALQGVLDEFFFLQADGWHNARCDVEIAAYQDKAFKASLAGQKSAEVRRTKGLHKPARSTKGKDIPPSEGGGAAGSVDVEREAEAGNSSGAAGAEQTLNERTTNQNQNQTIKETSSPKALRADADVPLQVGEWVAVFGDEFGVEVLPSHRQDRLKFWPLATRWVASGVSVGQMRRACEKARREAKEGIAYLPAYVDRVLVSLSAADVPVETDWQRSAREKVAAGAPFAAAADPATGFAPIDGFAFFDRAAASSSDRLEMA